MSDLVKVSVTLPREAVEQIKRDAEAEHKSPGTLILEALQINQRITRAERNRSKILIENPDGTMTRIVRQHASGGT